MPSNHIAYIGFGGPCHGVEKIGGAQDHPLWALTLCGLMTHQDGRIFTDPDPQSAVTCRSCRKSLASTTRPLAAPKSPKNLSREGTK